MAWSQQGDVSRLQFRAYVDDRPVDLPGAVCNTSAAVAECSAPLPSLTDGVHTIAVVNVLFGIESERTNVITVQKTSARSVLAATLPLASRSAGALRLDSIVTIADGLSYTADIVATGVGVPAQLAWVPDGRLFVADGDGSVRVLRPGESERGDVALEAGMLAQESIGTLGIASHPDFAQNRLVYVSLFERERSDRTVLRVVRLREAGDRLGEPATIYLAPIDDVADSRGPRMAFGPDKLLYVLLPPAPRASMLRLSDSSGVVTAESLPSTDGALGFTWTPGTADLLVVAPSGNAARPGVRSLRARASNSTLLLQANQENLALAKTLASARNLAARLAIPAQMEGSSSAMQDQIGDVVSADDGTLFVTASSEAPGSRAGTTVVVRLRRR